VSYDEFKALYDRGVASIGVGRSDAFRIIEFLPTRYRAIVYFFSFLWLLSIPMCIAVSIFYRWWLGLILLVVIQPTFFSAIKRWSAERVLDHALQNPEFFDALMSLNMLVVKRRDI
jgi:hypothetical protein